LSQSLLKSGHFREKLLYEGLRATQKESQSLLKSGHFREQKKKEENAEKLLKVAIPS